MSSQEQRLYDLESMMRWGRYWLVNGVNVYEPGIWGAPDSPPIAIVLLSPLGLLPLAAAHPEASPRGIHASLVHRADVVTHGRRAAGAFCLRSGAQSSVDTNC